MARKKITEKKPAAEENEESTVAPELEEGMSENELEPDESEEMELSEIPIEQFLKDPKMSEITEESDVEEVTAWCPICNDYTIFVDKTCTVCGFVKGSAKKTADKEETEESTESTFDLIPSDEVIDEMGGMGGFNEEENSEDY